MNNTELVIKQLSDTAAASKEELQIKPYHPEDTAAAAALQKYTDNLFKERVKLMRQMRSDRTETADDCTYDVLRRRKNAVIDLAYPMGKRFRSKYPMLSIEEEFVRLNAPTAALTFDGLNSSAHIELAAAIWILDYLLENERMDQALAYLPSSRDALDSVDFPNISDSVHNDDMLKGILYVIRNRNRGKVGFDPNKALIDDADTLLNTSDTSALTNNRKNYEAIIHLIDTQIICDIREMFLSAMIQVTDKLLNIIWGYQTQIRALNEEKLRIINEMTEAYRSVIGHVSAGAVTFSGTSDEAELLPQVIKARDEVLAINEKLNSLRFQKESFCLNMPLFACGKTDEFKESLDDPVWREMPVVDTVHPYAFCFGFLNLLDTDSDHAWTYNIPLYVLASACSALPWAVFGDPEEVDPAFMNAAVSNSDRYIVSPAQNVLNQKIVDPPFTTANGEKLSFKQLVYLITELVPPRDSAGMSYMKALFENSGLSKGEIDILYEYLSLAYSVSRRDMDYVFVDEEDLKPKEDPHKDNEGAVDDAELKALRQENKKLKGIINRLEHKIKNDAQELLDTQNNLDAAFRELGELRSMIRRAAPADEAFTTEIDFPYVSKKRAVVFGGHESWRKAIKPLLENVRFIENSSLPNTALIMNAEVIWIQTNAMGHSSFYKIIDLIRKHDIELHYFKYSSAEKCAEQFALEDMDGADDGTKAEE